MSNRTEYEMTAQDLKDLLAAAKPLPIAPQCGEPTSSSQRANAIWERIAERMCFMPYTVRGVPGKGRRFFTAVAKVARDA